MVSLRTRFPARLTRFALVAACLLSAVGCYGDPLHLSGTVSVAGQPVPGGTVYFTDDLDQSTVSAIFSNGTYAVTALVQGHTYTITLTNPEAPLPGVIPDRYADPKTSGLSYTAPTDVGHGTISTIHDIDLTP